MCAGARHDLFCHRFLHLHFLQVTQEHGLNVVGAYLPINIQLDLFILAQKLAIWLICRVVITEVARTANVRTANDSPHQQRQT